MPTFNHRINAWIQSIKSQLIHSDTSSAQLVRTHLANTTTNVFYIFSTHVRTQKVAFSVMLRWTAAIKTLVARNLVRRVVSTNSNATPRLSKSSRSSPDICFHLAFSLESSEGKSGPSLGVVLLWSVFPPIFWSGLVGLLPWPLAIGSEDRLSPVWDSLLRRLRGPLSTFFEVLPDAVSLVQSGVASTNF